VQILGNSGLTVQAVSSSAALSVNQGSTGRIAEFLDGGAVVAAFDAVGNLGVGTGSPAAKLNVVEASTNANAVSLRRNAVATVNADLLELATAVNSDPNSQFIEAENGADIEFRVWGDGDVTADGTFIGGGADFAEMVKVTRGAHSVEPGDVIVIDAQSQRGFVKSSEARSTLVAGVYSTKPGVLASEHDWDQLAIEVGLAPPVRDGGESAAVKPLEVGRRIDEVPLAVVGIVPCKASAENGPIAAGDLLVTSTIPGHAMRDGAPNAGTIVGKALGSLSSGTGVIPVLVTLQ
jgi:hypothetical protein